LFGKPPRKTDSPETVPEGLCGLRYKLHPFMIFSHLVKSVGLTPLGCALRFFLKNHGNTQPVKCVVLTPIRVPRIGNYRIICHIDNEGKEIMVVAIGDRKNIYNQVKRKP
ncbi:MAG: type II toxin-antitoxin system RelE/ParE family toxin, partial [Methanomethylovorans sp.]|nr:type II toxin-antitoxin system RelE/ParE family toxin [Methanomethylovorans sp.]